MTDALPRTECCRSRRLMLVLSGLGLTALAVAAFVWPGFFRTGGLSTAALANQAEARNLLAFVPADSSFVAGIRIGHVRKQPELHDAWNKLRQQLAQFQNIPAAAHELIADGDMVLVAGAGGAQGRHVCVVSTEHPLDANKIKKAVGATASQRHHGCDVYPCGDFFDLRPTSLAFPTDKIAMLALLPSADLGRAVADATEPRLHADLKAQVEQVSGSVIWCAVRFDDATQRGLRKLEAWAEPYAVFIPEIKTIAPLAQRGKGAVVTLDLAEPQKVKLAVGFTCHDADDAAQLRSAVLNLWINQNKKLVGMAGLLGGAKLSKLLAEVSQTFDLEQRDNSVLLSIQVSQATLEDLLHAAPVLNLVGKD